MDIYIIIAVVLLIIISAIADRSKTWTGAKRGLVMLRNLLPKLLLLVVLVSTFLGVISKGTLAHMLSQGSGLQGVLIAAGIGSVTFIPIPIAFPMAEMLLESGVGYNVLAVFITTMLMVGVVSFPVEKEYFGTYTTVLRNLLSFAGALLVGLIMGVLL